MHASKHYSDVKEASDSTMSTGTTTNGPSISVAYKDYYCAIGIVVFFTLVVGATSTAWRAALAQELGRRRAATSTAYRAALVSKPRYACVTITCQHKRARDKHP